MNRNWFSNGAVAQPSVKSEMECRAVCFKDQDCVSYRIDGRPGRSLCSIQKNSEKLAAGMLKKETSVKEYIIVDRRLDQYEVSHDKGLHHIKKFF